MENFCSVKLCFLARWALDEQGLLSDSWKPPEQGDDGSCDQCSARLPLEPDLAWGWREWASGSPSNHPAEQGKCWADLLETSSAGALLELTAEPLHWLNRSSLCLHISLAAKDAGKQQDNHMRIPTCYMEMEFFCWVTELIIITQIYT